MRKGLGTAKSSTFENLLLHLILHELNFRELGSAGLWRKRNKWTTSLNALFYPLVWKSLKISAYVSFLYLRVLCDAIQWWHCFDAWKTPPRRRIKGIDSGIHSSSMTPLCMSPNLQGNEGFRGGHQRHWCCGQCPGSAGGTGKLLTAITGQRKLLTVKPLALKTETVLEVWQDMVHHWSARDVTA